MWKAWLTILKDLALFGGGLFLVLHEELARGEVSVPLLVVGTSMMGIPGALAAYWLGKSDTASPSLPAPSAGPQQL